MLWMMREVFEGKSDLLIYTFLTLVGLLHRLYKEVNASYHEVDFVDLDTKRYVVWSHERYCGYSSFRAVVDHPGG